MQTKKRIVAISLATAAALIFSSLPHYAFAQADRDEQVKCFGVNACKGQGACKSNKNTCKAENACKGQGFSMYTEDDCFDLGGDTVER